MAFEYIDIYIYLICMYSKWASVVGVVNGQKVRDFGEIFPPKYLVSMKLGMLNSPDC